MQNQPKTIKMAKNFTGKKLYKTTKESCVKQYLKMTQVKVDKRYRGNSKINRRDKKQKRLLLFIWQPYYDNVLVS